MSSRALIMVAGADGNTMHIALAIGRRLRRAGHRVDIADALAVTPEPSLGNYASVIFGTEVGHARDRRALGSYIARHRVRLSEMPTGLFVVADARRASRGQVDTFASELSWRPNFAAVIPVRDRDMLRGTAHRLVTAILGAMLGSRNVARLDEVTALADAIARELPTQPRV